MHAQKPPVETACTCTSAVAHSYQRHGRLPPQAVHWGLLECRHKLCRLLASPRNLQTKQVAKGTNHECCDLMYKPCVSMELQRKEKLDFAVSISDVARSRPHCMAMVTPGKALSLVAYFYFTCSATCPRASHGWGYILHLRAFPALCDLSFLAKDCSVSQKHLKII